MLAPNRPSGGPRDFPILRPAFAVAPAVGGGEFEAGLVGVAAHEAHEAVPLVRIVEDEARLDARWVAPVKLGLDLRGEGRVSPYKKEEEKGAASGRPP